MIFDTNGGPQSIDINDKYKIYTQLCTLSKFEDGTDVESVVYSGVRDPPCILMMVNKILINHVPVEWI